MKNFLLFVGVIFGTVLLVAGFNAISRGDSGGWMYVLGAVAAFALASAPGRRLLDSVLTPPPRD